MHVPQHAIIAPLLVFGKMTLRCLQDALSSICFVLTFAVPRLRSWHAAKCLRMKSVRCAQTFAMHVPMNVKSMRIWNTANVVQTHAVAAQKNAGPWQRKCIDPVLQSPIGYRHRYRFGSDNFRRRKRKTHPYADAKQKSANRN
jgi:hypothetical protein